MSNLPLVSVIVPVYNAERYFERCLNSLFNQTIDDIEYIFVDDCTPDKSFEVLDRVLVKYPSRVSSVKIIHLETNMKQAAARQAGLNHATGKYVIHCDPDDWVDVEYYEGLLRRAIETGADVVVGDYDVHEDGGCATKCINKEYERPIDIILDNKCFFTSLCMTLISRNLIESNDIKFYPGINCMEDQGFISRVLYFAKQIEFVHTATYHYNKENIESITHRLRSPEVVAQRVKCLTLIDEFFITHGISPSHLGLSLRVKRDIKDQFLSLKTLNEWKSLFPEVIHWEWKNSEANLIYRLSYYWSHIIGVWPMRLYLMLCRYKGR